MGRQIERIEVGTYSAEITLQLGGAEWSIMVDAEYRYYPPEPMNGILSGTIEIGRLVAQESNLQIVIDSVPEDIDLKAEVVSELGLDRAKFQNKPWREIENQHDND